MSFKNNNVECLIVMCDIIDLEKDINNIYELIVIMFK